MDEDTRIRLEVLEELVRELIRRDILTEDAINSVAARFAVKAQNHEGSSRGDAYAHAAFQVEMLPIEADEPIVRQSDVRAEFQRKQIRERTACLSRPSREDE